MDKDLPNRPQSTPKQKTNKKSKAAEEKDARGNDESFSYSLDETGDSTRSLLSVLSHSSTGDVHSKSDRSSTGSESNEAKSKSSLGRSDSRNSSASSRTRYSVCILCKKGSWTLLKV